MTIVRQSRRRFAAAFLLLILAIAPGAQAQQIVATVEPASVNAAQDSAQQAGVDVPPQPGPKLLSNYAEAGGDYLTLTNGFGYWAGGYARGVVTKGNNIWNA